jgi:hypothetical protein
VADWNPGYVVYIEVCDNEGTMPGKDWQGVVSAVRHVLSTFGCLVSYWPAHPDCTRRECCLRAGIGNRERLDHAEFVLAEVCARFPGAGVTMTAGQLSPLGAGRG